MGPLMFSILIIILALVIAIYVHINDNMAHCLIDLNDDMNNNFIHNDNGTVTRTNMTTSSTETIILPEVLVGNDTNGY